ncbi:MAG: hypothetical protein LBD50_00390 [Rickettsiales bacterium]|jgi:UDP-galactopyranose mutase|nr:hypothetical protein [Rickettsiales bacterium]
MTKEKISNIDSKAIKIAFILWASFVADNNPYLPVNEKKAEELWQNYERCIKKYEYSNASHVRD